MLPARGGFAARSLRLLLPWCLHGRALSLAARTFERDHARLLLGAGARARPTRRSRSSCSTRPTRRPSARCAGCGARAGAARVCADGGANRVHDATAARAAPALAPDLVVGDLDSLRPDVRAALEDAGVAIARAPGQDRHDLDKALAAVLELGAADAAAGGGPRDVIVWGAFGDRFDHVMASVDALFRWADRFDGELALLSRASVATLLPAGRSVIRPARPVARARARARASPDAPQKPARARARSRRFKHASRPFPSHRARTRAGPDVRARADRRARARSA